MRSDDETQLVTVKATVKNTTTSIPPTGTTTFPPSPTAPPTTRIPQHRLHRQPINKQLNLRITATSTIHQATPISPQHNQPIPIQEKPTRHTTAIHRSTTTQVPIQENTHAQNSTNHSAQPTGQPTSQTRIPQSRPGRIPFRKSQTIDIERSYGSRYTDRSPSCIRIFFQNTKGLSYSATGEDYNYYLTCTKALGADIIGMAETNTAWQHPHLRFHFNACARRHYPLMKAVYSSPTSEIDPIPEKDTFQSGGTAMLTTADLVPMVFGANDDDPSGLGRWSSQTIRGKNNKLFTAITGYRVSKGTISAKTVGSAFSREYEHHRTCNIKSPQPRKIYLTDLKVYILK